MDLMGFGEDIPEEVEGTSYAPMARGSRQSRPQSQLCLRMPADQPGLGWRAVRTHTHTLVVKRDPGEADRVLLYDSIEDPYQLVDVAGDSPELVARISEELDDWLRRTKDPWLDASA